ncbi:hypothetical protein [Cellvibrio sp. OA-2007]|uniref:hypothetical protein n=1 Tax=Cellvibrio sp. OA-2007 TaxID=529823 RepID=UPI0007834B9E|nr:hypothetical protein [Cellvibrio sp. OA-2007]
MNNHDINETPLGAQAPQEEGSNQNAQPQWVDDLEQTLLLGKQFSKFAIDLMDLAGAELLLAVKSFPKLIMLWLLMMPIILLSWCAFSGLIAWFVFALSAHVGLSLLAVFLLQILLLISCRWLFVQYRKRMTLPYTRDQISSFMRSINNEFNERHSTEK